MKGSFYNLLKDRKNVLIQEELAILESLSDGRAKLNLSYCLPPPSEIIPPPPPSFPTSTFTPSRPGPHYPKRPVPPTFPPKHPIIPLKLKSPRLHSPRGSANPTCAQCSTKHPRPHLCHQGSAFSPLHQFHYPSSSAKTLAYRWSLLAPAPLSRTSDAHPPSSPPSFSLNQ